MLFFYVSKGYFKTARGAHPEVNKSRANEGDVDTHKHHNLGTNFDIFIAVSSKSLSVF